MGSSDSKSRLVKHDVQKYSISDSLPPRKKETTQHRFFFVGTDGTAQRLPKSTTLRQLRQMTLVVSWESPGEFVGFNTWGMVLTIAFP